MTSDHIEELLGGYVLGALEPDEHDHVTAHLASCQRCRREHERLAGVPAMLELVVSAEPSAAPAGLEATVLDAIHDAARQRQPSSPWWSRGSRGRRPLVGAALAGAAAAAVVLTVLGGLGEQSTDSLVVQLGSSSLPAATASAELRPAPGGTRVTLTASGLPPTRAGEIYELWFVRDTGRVSAGTFTVTRDDDLRVDLTTAARPAGYTRIGITREPDGLDPARNGPNILAGPIVT